MIDQSLNPFGIDKSVSAADNIIAPKKFFQEEKLDIEPQKTENVHDVHHVHKSKNNENVHHVHFQTEEKIEGGCEEIPLERRGGSSSGGTGLWKAGKTHPKKAEKEKEERKHINFAMSQDRYEMLKKMASIQHLTVTKCLSNLIEEQYHQKWEPLCHQIDQVRKKMEKKSPKDDILNR